MKRRLLKICLLLVASSLLLGAAIYWLNKEPSYNGRPLSAWVTELQSHDTKTRRAAQEALEEMGEAVVPALTRELERNPGIFQRAHDTLARHTPQKIKGFARKLLRSDSPEMRKVAVVRVLQQYGTNAQAAVPVLAKLLRDPDALLSGVAGQALGQMGPAAVPELVRALDEGDYMIRANACTALASLGTNAAPAIRRLCKIIESESGPILGTASYTLSRIGLPAVEPLLPLLLSTNWEVRRWSAYALAYVGPSAQRAVPSLLPLTEDEHPQVRWTAMHALGRIGIDTPEAEAVLFRNFKSPDANIRSAAVQAASLRPLLVMYHLTNFTALLSDSSPEVRGHTAYVIGLVGEYSRSAIPELEKLASDEDAFAKDHAKKALQTIRDSIAATEKKPANTL